MSDFVAPAWAWYVAILTVGSIVGCLVLLAISARTRVAADAQQGDPTTGHTWDGDIRELNNPLPRWWAILFVITVVFALAYVFLYPGLGTTQGQLQWSSTGQYNAEAKALTERAAPLYAKLVALDPKDMGKDPQAMAVGERLFMNNCAQCHGSDARGGKSFPNLTDGDWLHGGTPEAIAKTISEGRNGMMPPMAAAVGTPDEVRNVAHYVLSLSGSPHDSLRAQLGKPKFGACAACHGMDGKGNTALGAPNLTDQIWLHGWGEAAIVKAITQGINNNMPAQARLLTPEQIQVLTGYVLNLSASAPRQ
jgi:cytochrome c oxidase cbb3-type subunit III